MLEQKSKEKLKSLDYKGAVKAFRRAEKYFSRMNYLNKKLNLKESSMGMSSDYLEAIQYNATYLRIGTNIFGERYLLHKVDLTSLENYKSCPLALSVSIVADDSYVVIRVCSMTCL